MKTLREIEEIEKYLNGRLKTPSNLIFEARLIIDPGFKFRVECQRKLHSIVRHSGRVKIKVEAERIHQQLFNNPTKETFQYSVFQLFSKK